MIRKFVSLWHRRGNRRVCLVVRIFASCELLEPRAMLVGDGSLDTSFDVDWKRTVDMGGVADQAYGVAVQPDGKIVVAGRTNNTSDSDFAVARYNRDGSLDTSFGIRGKLITDFNRTADYATGVV